MAKPKNCIAINGAKYFIFQNSKGKWVGDPLVIQVFHTRTFIPIGREYKMTDTPELMINILRTDRVELKAENLSEETKKALDKAGIVYEVSGLEGKILEK